MLNITNRIILLIESSKWLQPQACQDLKMYDCTEPYEVFEKILLNVSASNSITWKVLYNSTSQQPEIFAELCAAVVLIDRYLVEIFKMSRIDREVLLGVKFTEILDFYYHSVN